MKQAVSWLKRKKGAFCILAGICCVSLFVIINSGEKIKENQGGFYAVKIKHYGIDAAEMERSVTIPLEDALFAIPGAQAVQSSSENSLSSVYISFKSAGRGRRSAGTYEAVRDAAQRVYETLPSSVQRPEILSSGSSRVPVFSASVYADNFASHMLEKIVKPRLESLEGAGEVLVSGVGLNEIYIILDQEKLVSLGLEPSEVSSSLAMNDSIFSAGTITEQNRELIITVDGRYLQSPEKALISLGEGKFIELSEIAVITQRERTPEILSRLNGKKTASIAIMGRHGADLRKLSSDIKRELSFLTENQKLPLEFIVLSDLGAEESAAYRSVFNAALLGAILTAAISFLLRGKNSSVFSGFFCALAIPIICLVSAAILCAGGFSLNRLMLAGIAAGLGTAIDAVILCSERLRKCVSYETASVSLAQLSKPLLAGAATTIAALIPLFALEDGGIKTIASAICVVTFTALVMSLFLLPPLLLWETNSQKKKTSPLKLIPEILNEKSRQISRFFCRLLATNVKFCIRYPAVVLTIGLALTLLAIFALFSRGVDTSTYSSEDSVYGQVEFDGGLLAEEADKLLAAWSIQLAANAGIKNIETGARTGSASLLISFDPKQTQAHLVREAAKKTPILGGFIFFHESSSKERYWEIKVYGDEDQKCREIAQELAYLSGGHPLIRERVLNFKQGSKKMILLPDRELLTESGTGFSNAANKARIGVYGPVAYKRTDTDGETDVRILTSANMENNVLRQTREGTLGILVSNLRLDSLMRIKEETEPSSIRRDNRRRTASITITTAVMDPRRVKQKLAPLFEKLELPSGYSVEFDPQAIKQSQALSATFLSLILAVIFCYMIIASINESFIIPLIVLSAIPPSLAIPALCLALSGSSYNSAVACAFIAVSGMTVNASVLCADGIRRTDTFSIYCAIRKKMPALLATTGTTVACALPFLFLKEGANILIRTLSLVGALGVTCSCICSITIIPSFFKLLTPLVRGSKK